MCRSSLELRMGKLNVSWIVLSLDQDDVLALTCLAGAPALTLGNKGSEALMSHFLLSSGLCLPSYSCSYRA